jgi:hypothetical protein
MLEDLALPVQQGFHEVEIRRNQMILSVQLIKSLVQSALTRKHQVGQADGDTSGDSGQAVNENGGVFASCFLDERNCI